MHMIRQCRSVNYETRITPRASIGSIQISKSGQCGTSEMRVEAPARWAGVAVQTRSEGSGRVASCEG
jgi:hypothetical protein